MFIIIHIAFVFNNNILKNETITFRKIQWCIFNLRYSLKMSNELNFTNKIWTTMIFKHCFCSKLFCDVIMHSEKFLQTTLDTKIILHLSCFEVYEDSMMQHDRSFCRQFWNKKELISCNVSNSCWYGVPTS